MSDAYISWGGYLQIGANGDLLTTTGPALTQQRAIRRLLTNPGSYIWNLTYGAGIARFIGQPNQPNQVSALVAVQLALESTIATSPVPSGVVTTASTGVTTLTVSYTPISTGTATTISQPVA
jgi:hypothetical protein